MESTNVGATYLAHGDGGGSEDAATATRRLKDAVGRLEAQLALGRAAPRARAQVACHHDRMIETTLHQAAQ